MLSCVLFETETTLSWFCAPFISVPFTAQCEEFNKRGDSCWAVRASAPVCLTRVALSGVRLGCWVLADLFTTCSNGSYFSSCGGDKWPCSKSPVCDAETRLIYDGGALINASHQFERDADSSPRWSLCWNLYWIFNEREYNAIQSQWFRRCPCTYTHTAIKRKNRRTHIV